MPDLRIIRVLFAALLLTFVAAAPATQPTSEYIAPGAIDLKAVLPDPPANDSAQTKVELAQMLTIQDSRTREEIDRARSEVELTGQTFEDVIGASFEFTRFPITDHLIKQVAADTDLVTKGAKRYWSRPRPYELDPRITPVVAKPGNKSYPSGHATRAYAMAVVLAELFPDKKEALLVRAARIGEDRIIGGVHYPSDIAAGKKLGELIARKILASSAFEADEAQAKAELAARN